MELESEDLSDSEIGLDEQFDSLDQSASQDFSLVLAFRRALAGGRVAAGDLLRFGQSFEAAGILDLALEAYQRAIEIDHENLTAHVLLGCAHSTSLGRALLAGGPVREITSNALTAFGRALELDPTDSEALAGFVECQLILGHTTEAVAAARRWFKVVGDAPGPQCDVLSRLGFGCLLGGNLEGAENYFHLMLEYLPNNSIAIFGSALVSLRSDAMAFSEKVRLLKELDEPLAEGLLRLSRLKHEMQYSDIIVEMLVHQPS